MVEADGTRSWERLSGEAGDLGTLEAVPAWIESALTQVLRDLQRPQRVAIRIGWTASASAAEGEEGLLWFQEVRDESAMFGVHLPPRQLDAASCVAWLAERLQDEWFETSAAWAEARPPCPGHQHPAVPDVRDSVAVWVCPQAHTALWPIGHAP